MQLPDSTTIHLRVPATTKAIWVRQSRAAGMRLTDWIVQRVEKFPQEGKPFSSSEEMTR